MVFSTSMIPCKIGYNVDIMLKIGYNAVFAALMAYSADFFQSQVPRTKRYLLYMQPLDTFIWTVEYFWLFRLTVNMTHVKATRPFVTTTSDWEPNRSLRYCGHVLGDSEDGPLNIERQIFFQRGSAQYSCILSDFSKIWGTGWPWWSATTYAFCWLFLRLHYLAQLSMQFRPNLQLP